MHAAWYVSRVAAASPDSAFYWLFYVQFPLAIYQVLVVVPKRVALRGEDEKWDSVVGTFGGDPMGGGNTAAMGMFCLLIMLLKVSEFKHGICSFKSMAAHIVLAFSSAWSAR